MRLSIFGLLALFLVFGCSSSETSEKLPRIAIAGLAIESSTFSLPKVMLLHLELV
ncbi:hypothetical protein [Algoriphagus halophilus]|uniref:hypothetical protein n=1 Tax=Algoriphagus halophilus TaxID=226505 RepID=UPI00358E182D